MAFFIASRYNLCGIKIIKMKFDRKELPTFEKIYGFVSQVRRHVFDGAFSDEMVSLDDVQKTFEEVISPNSKIDIKPYIIKLEEELKEDLSFFMESDPAIESELEVVLTYPGFLAIFSYRLAHILCGLGIHTIPRIITEKAHSITGIDIHPDATIGVPFFIDHGTGIVIGQTTEIGKYCKLYHGVTLGALSLGAGARLKGTKRHPTIGNFVTIYSGASILGGETVIGDHVTIGSNVFVVNSVLENTKAIYATNSIKFEKK